MSERTLSERELNRALLARQLLLERAKASVPRAVEKLGGLQTQYAPSPYVALWSRLEGFSRDDLTKALERRSVVQGTLLRSTIHMVSARDYWPTALAIRETRREWWLRQGRVRSDVQTMEAVAQRVRGELATGPRRRSEIEESLGAQQWNGAGLWVDLVRLPPSGTWEQRRADLYGLAESELGPPGEATPELGAELLVRRYLGGFGPAPVADVANWAGLAKPTVADAAARLSLRRFRDEQGRELLDLPRAPLPDPEEPAPVRFLPWWDATLLVHARRTGILPEELRPLVFNTRTPHSTAVFLVDGRVAGKWSHERGRIVLEPFGRLARAARKEADEEAARLADFYR